MNQPTRQGHVPKSVKKGNPKFECFNESMQNTMKLYNINLLLFQSSNATLHNLLVCCYSLGLFRLNRGTCKLLNLMTKWWAWKQKLQVIGGNHTMYDWKTLVDLHRFTLTKSQNYIRLYMHIFRRNGYQRKISKHPTYSSFIAFGGWFVMRSCKASL